MKWIVSMLMAVGLLSAQGAFDPPTVETLVTPLGVPCEPGQPNPFGENFPVVCPPADQQGAMVFVRAAGATSAGYKVTVNYTAADGSTQTSVKTIARNADGDWTTVVFQIGRMQTPSLTGNQVTSVTVDLVDSLDVAGDPEPDPGN